MTFALAVVLATFLIVAFLVLLLLAAAIVKLWMED